MALRPDGRGSWVTRSSTATRASRSSTERRRPHELAAAAAEQGHEALAITDHDGVWGAMEFASACQPLGVRPIVGAELTVAPPVPGTVSTRTLPFHLTLLVESAAGLAEPLPAPHRSARPYTAARPSDTRDALPPFLPLSSLEQRTEGLVCLSGCARDGALAGIFERAGGMPSGADSAAAVALGERLVRAFGRDGFRVELQRPLWRHDMARNRWLAGLAERLGVPCVATGNVHAHDPSRAALQDALVAIRLGGVARRDGGAPAGQLALGAARRRRRWRGALPSYPDAVAESGRLAERLRFNLALRSRLPLPGRRGRGRRPRAGGAVRGALRGSLRRHARAAERRSGAWRTSSG